MRAAVRPSFSLGDRWRHALKLRLSLFLWLTIACTAIVHADTTTTITLIPPNPAPSTQIELHIEGTSPVFSPVYFYTFTIVGQTIRVEGCVPPGFDTPSEYEFSTSIGALGLGSYALEYYTLDCGPQGQPGNPTGPQTLRATLNFSVLSAGSSVEPIPTLQAGAIAFLVAALSLTVIALYRRQTRP